MDVDFSRSDAGLGVIFRGKLGTDATLEASPKVLENIQGSTDRVWFDLAGVDYVCSCFLRLCLQAVKTVGRDRFEVRNVTPQVMRVFKTAGFDAMAHVS